MDKKISLFVGILLVLSVFMFGFSGCEHAKKDLQINSVVISGPSGRHNFSVEIANNEVERAKGLMFREVLNDSDGMLFVYDKEDTPGFWMKNTLIPLDMLFIDKDLKIIDINKNAVPCTDKGCPIYYARSPVEYILEINGGLSEKFNMTLGDKVKIVG